MVVCSMRGINYTHRILTSEEKKTEKNFPIHCSCTLLIEVLHVSFFMYYETVENSRQMLYCAAHRVPLVILKNILTPCNEP